MKRFAVSACVLGLAGIALTLGGCQTLTDTPGANANRIAHATVTDWRQAPDDAEQLLLLDRPVQLSNVPVPSR